MVEWHAGGPGDALRYPGETKSEYYERFNRHSKIPDEPETPDCIAHVLEWFFELSERRQPAFSGVSPITFNDIMAWNTLTEAQATPEEIKMLLAIDRAYCKHQAREETGPNETPPPTGFFGTKG